MRCTACDVVVMLIGFLLIAGFIWLWWWLDNKRPAEKGPVNNWTKFGIILGILTGAGFIGKGINLKSPVNPYI